MGVRHRVVQVERESRDSTGVREGWRQPVETHSLAISIGRSGRGGWESKLPDVFDGLTPARTILLGTLISDWLPDTQSFFPFHIFEEEGSLIDCICGREEGRLTSVRAARCRPRRIVEVFTMRRMDPLCRRTRQRRRRRVESKSVLHRRSFVPSDVHVL